MSKTASEHMSPTGIVAIPARLASTRLPNKLLLRATGRPLLAHVIERAVQAVRQSQGTLQQVVVACDDEELVQVAKTCGVPAVMTGQHHRCGTTRIAEAIEKILPEHPPEFVVNVQGDEPELAPEAILEVASQLLADPSAPMATLAIGMPADAQEQKANPNIVKAVLDDSGRALYFSRSPVPYNRNQPAEGEFDWYHHLGVYAYRYEFLREFARMPSCPLEERESLEQLRALNAAKTIRVGVIPAAWAGKGIDTPEDYAAFVGRQAA